MWASLLLGACAPLVVGTAVVGGSLVAIDRRTSGAQLEDQAIELKGAARVREVASLAHVNITSYNRLVLLTGEVPNDTDRQLLEQTVSRIENVRSVVNELVVAPASSLSARSSDAILSARVKASFVDARDLQAQAFKVVTERSVVHLLGRVTEREAQRAAEIARAIPGVQKVVRVFELISESELSNLQPKASPR
ncbi:MAG TPA: BON domain-containing protein [Rubrivivax sp.]|nr:BON domain-containing protein [Rubrivivax sp.]